MVVAHLHEILDAEPCTVTGELRFWGDVGENEEDEFVWEFENCENRIGWIGIRSREPMEVFIQRLVWGSGDPRDFDGGVIDRRCFLPRLHTSLVRNVEVFSR